MMRIKDKIIVGENGMTSLNIKTISYEQLATNQSTIHCSGAS